MIIHVRRVIAEDAEEYIVFRAGEYQHPIGILSRYDLMKFAEAIEVELHKPKPQPVASGRP